MLQLSCASYYSVYVTVELCNLNVLICDCLCESLGVCVNSPMCLGNWYDNSIEYSRSYKHILCVCNF